MVSKNNYAQHTQLIHELSRKVNEPMWLLDHRLEALGALQEVAEPQIERLDYTHWNLFDQEAVQDHQISSPRVQPVEQEKQTDNLFQTSSKGLKEWRKTPEGVIISDFSTIDSQEESLFKRLYQETEFVNFKDAFNAFNTALLTSGLFIYIPKGIHVEDALKISFLDDVKTGESKNHQVFVYAEANSSIEIIENYSSIEHKEKTNKLLTHVHIQAQTGANVKYTAINELSKETTAFFRRTAKTAKDARIEIALGMMNNGDAIEDVQVDLVGDGSSADVKSVAISHSTQVQCVNAKVVNQGAHTLGNIYQHGAVLDQATLTFNGIGDVVKQAKHSDAQQESRILMLSDQARADTNPLLLIDEYELTAGHAASISRVDEEQLYYLMSRGLEKTQAEKLVIRGFLGSVLSAISIKEVREKFVETIERKLSAL